MTLTLGLAGLRFTQQPGSLGGNCLQSSEGSHCRQRGEEEGGEENREERREGEEEGRGGRKRAEEEGVTEGIMGSWIFLPSSKNLSLSPSEAQTHCKYNFGRRPEFPALSLPSV